MARGANKYYQIIVASKIIKKISLCVISIYFVSAYGATYTWTGATSNVWSVASNWTPSGPPLTGDVATFVNSVINPSSAGTESFASIIFDTSASPYTVTNTGTFTLTSSVINNSASTQTLTNTGGTLNFNNVSIGNNIIITNNSGGTITVTGTSTASNSIFTLNGGGSASTLNLSGVIGNLSIGSLSSTASNANLTLPAVGNTLTLNGLNTTTTIAGVISGSGNLTKAGNGTLTVTGVNTYTGSTTIAGGVLEVGDGSTPATTLSSNIDVGSNILRFNTPAGGLSYGNVISSTTGMGTVTKTGSGTLTLTGSNTFTGTTTISQGIFQIGGGGASGSYTGNITLDNSGALAFNRTGTLTYSGVISGTSSATPVLTKLGSGTVILTGLNTYTGPTTLTAGTLQIGNGSGTTMFASSIAVGGNTLFFNIPSTGLTDPGNISGSGSITKLGTGTLSLTGLNNSFSGTTTVSAGVLQIGDGSTSTGSFTGNIAFSGTGSLIFNTPASTALTYSGVISGVSGVAAALTKSGAGTLNLTGTNTYTGPTSVLAGTLNLTTGTSGSYTLTGGTLGIIGSAVSIGFTSGNGIINVGTGNTLTITETNNGLFSGTISGGGNLIKAGNSNLILSGSNTYTGSTTVSAGTLQIGNAMGTTTFASSGIAVGGNIVSFTLPGSGMTYAGNLSGTGSITKFGGTLRLTGANNTFTGTTTISTGVLQIGDGTTSAGSYAGNITLAASGSVIFSTPASSILTYTALLQGSTSATNAVTKSGTGTINLTGANTYSGGTLITGGTLTITTGTLGAYTLSGTGILDIGGAAVSIGNLTGTINNTVSLGNNALTITQNTNGSFAGVISGTGTLAKVGSATLTLSGNNSYTGSTTITAGTLQIGDGINSTTFSSNSISLNSALIFNLDNAGLSYSGSISGSGTLTKSGNGTLILSGNNTYTGSTSLTGGSLQIGDGVNTTVFSASSISSSGALIFNISSAGLNYGGSISGTGTLTKSGTGTLTLSGNNTYTGATMIAGGTLALDGNISQYLSEITNNGTFSLIGSQTSVMISALAGETGSILLNNHTLTTNQTMAGIFGGDMSGGSLIKNGSESLTLNGTNTLDTVTVNNGSLIVGDATHTNATLISAVTINNGATLEGYGMVGNDSSNSLVNQGIVNPGASIGTMVVNGDYTQASNATLDIEIDSGGNNDLLQVNGAAALNGTLTITPLDGFLPLHNYVFLTATDGITGSFSNTNLETFTQGFLKASLTYGPNTILFGVNFDPNLFASAALTPNQIALSNYILTTNLQNSAAVLNLFESINTATQFQNAIDQISGATYANQTLELAQLGEKFANQIGDRLTIPFCTRGKWLDEAMSESSPQCKIEPVTWMNLSVGQDQIISEEVSGLNTKQETMGWGIDFPITPQSLFGTALNVSHFHGNATTRETAVNKGDLFQIGIYTRYQLLPWSMAASVTGGLTDEIVAHRYIQSATDIVQTSGNYYSSFFLGQFKLSYDFKNKNVWFEPFLGLLVSEAIRPAFNEISNTGFELRLNRSTYFSCKSQLGFQTNWKLVNTLYALIVARWDHEWEEPFSTFTANLIEVNASNLFYIKSQSIGRNTGVVRAGLSLLTHSKWNMTVFYETQFAHDWESNTGNLQFNWRF